MTLSPNTGSASLSVLLYLLVGVINFAPILGITGETRLEAGYGIEITDPNTVLLMQHRAVLFGIIGGFVLLAAFKREFRKLASAMALISMTSFILVIEQAANVSEQMATASLIDMVAVLMLAAAFWLERKAHNTPQVEDDCAS